MGKFSDKLNSRDWKREKKKLLKRTAVTAENFFLANFKREGFLDDSVERWQPRKKQTGRRETRRSLLVKSGRLRRDTRASIAGSDRIVVVNDTPYARRHNEGLDGMPKRKFMGKSKKLHKRIGNEINKALKNSFK